jgi:PadR family transcriptional regulator PadR
MEAQLKKGVIEILTLAVLRRGDSYGYKIIQDIGTVHVISESTLYPILKRLEQQNCLRSYSDEYNGRLRKYYTITKNGQDKINAFLEEWKEIKAIFDFINA